MRLLNKTTGSYAERPRNCLARPVKITPILESRHLRVNPLIK